MDGRGSSAFKSERCFFCWGPAMNGGLWVFRYQNHGVLGIKSDDDYVSISLFHP